MWSNFKMNLKLVKTGVFGIQGSGKTYIVEKELIHSFKKPFVYLLHPEDFRSCKANVTVYIPYKLVKGKKMIDRSPEHLDRIIGLIVEQAKKGKYDAFILDEASTFLPKNYQSLQKYPNIIDLCDSHRHYGLAFVYMARRPQVISTEITETSEYLFLFAINGVNVNEYFGKIHEGFKELMPSLTKDKHNFILMQLGEKPKLYKAIKQKETKTNDKTRSKRITPNDESKHSSQR